MKEENSGVEVASTQPDAETVERSIFQGDVNNGIEEPSSPNYQSYPNDTYDMDSTFTLSSSPGKSKARETHQMEIEIGEDTITLAGPPFLDPFLNTGIPKDIILNKRIFGDVIFLDDSDGEEEKTSKLQVEDSSSAIIEILSVESAPTPIINEKKHGTKISPVSRKSRKRIRSASRKQAIIDLTEDGSDFLYQPIIPSTKKKKRAKKCLMIRHGHAPQVGGLSKSNSTSKEVIDID
mmetsp:Transcript_23017/g.35062  ORF Transcript_23017/g.35062 Transcript_23017/m.35062 type:complete len:236 (+) Transcript_23017:198-905(+)